MRIRKNNTAEFEEIELIAKCSDALAHPARVEFFKYIYGLNMERKTCCNKDLVGQFGYAQSTTSQHMDKLTISGLIETKHQGTSAFYFVNLGLLQKYLNAVKKLNER